MIVVPFHHVAALKVLLKHQRQRSNALAASAPVGPALDLLAHAQPGVPQAQRHGRCPRRIAPPQLDVRNLSSGSSGGGGSARCRRWRTGCCSGGRRG